MASRSDAASRERLFGARPMIEPITEHHAHRILRSIEALAEDASEDPLEGAPEPAVRSLHAIG